jgi:hypothetical protein
VPFSSSCCLYNPEKPEEFECRVCTYSCDLEFFDLLNSKMNFICDMFNAELKLLLESVEEKNTLEQERKAVLLARVQKKLGL